MRWIVLSALDVFALMIPWPLAKAGMGRAFGPKIPALVLDFLYKRLFAFTDSLNT